MQELSLAEAIRDLRKELIQAIETGKNESLQFSLGAVELELETQLTAGSGAKAGFKWVVVSVGGEAKSESSARHRVKLTLTPYDPENPAGSVLVSDDGRQPD